MRISDWSADVCSSDVFEGDGTLINYEGRAQRHFQVFDPTYYDASIGLVESWRWLADLEGASGWKIPDDVTVACAQAFPAPVHTVLPPPNEGSLLLRMDVV